MTDNEIIKALECHADYHSDNCFECPYLENLSAFDKNCVILMTEDVLDLINRQKAEIERLGGIIESYALQYGTATDRELFLSNARTKAVKEFAERLKKDRYVIFNTMYSDFWFSEAIDNLVKEFTEGEHYESQRAESNGSKKA